MIHIGTPPPEGRSTPEMDTGYPMRCAHLTMFSVTALLYFDSFRRGPVVPGPGKVPLLSG